MENQKVLENINSIKKKIKKDTRIIAISKRQPLKRIIDALDAEHKIFGANQVQENDQVMFISSSGNLIRTKIDAISVIGRNTQGVKLIRLSEKDKLLGLEKIMSDDDSED